MERFQLPSPEQFLDLLARSGLLSPDQLNSVHEVSAIKFGNSQSLDNLCVYLVAYGYLTTWQCNCLRRGRFKGFVFEDRFCLLDYLGSDETSSRYLAQDVVGGETLALQIFPRDANGRVAFATERNHGATRWDKSSPRP